MNNLLVKEFRLAANPLSFIFVAASAMTMLPGYPILVGAFFVCLGLFYSFQNARESQDVIYTSLLPVKKTGFVSAKYLFTVILQMASFVIMAALTALRMTVLADSQAYAKNALMNATPLFLAFVLLVFASFNVIFLGWHLRTAWRLGVPFFVFVGVAMVLVFAAEAIHFFPGMAHINDQHGAAMTFQIAVLAASAVIYGAGTFVSCRVTMRRFEKVDL